MFRPVLHASKSTRKKWNRGKGSILWPHVLATSQGVGRKLYSIQGNSGVKGILRMHYLLLPRSRTPPSRPLVEVNSVHLDIVKKEIQQLTNT